MKRIYLAFSIAEDDDKSTEYNPADRRITSYAFSTLENRQEFINTWIKEGIDKGNQATSTFPPIIGKEMVAHIYGHGLTSYTLEIDTIEVDTQETDWRV